MKTKRSVAKTANPNTLAARLKSACATKSLLPALLLFVLPAVVQAQFTFTTNNGAITITKYTGSGGAVVIPSVTNGFPVTVIAGDKGAFSGSGVTSVAIPNSVTNIGSFAFYNCTKLTSIIIPDSVIYVGQGAFCFCSSLTSAALGNNVASVGFQVFRACNNLTAITVSKLNTNYCSVAGVLFNKSQTVLVAYPPGKSGSYPIPNGVTSIGEEAFETCAGLTGVTIPNSVTSIGEEAFYSTSLADITIPNGVTNISDYLFYNCTRLASVTIGNSVTYLGYDAFSGCSSLAGIYFLGNAPSVAWAVFSDNPTVYYLPGTTGWGPPGTLFDGLPTALWLLPNPMILNFEPNFGVRTNRFGFTISWATNIPVVVEACTNFTSPVWQPVQTNTLTGGSSYFSDPQWTNYPARFYRLRSP